MEITEEFIKKLNEVIEVAIQHGGDVGGAYFCWPDEIYKQVQELTFLMGYKDLKVVWSENKYDKKAREYPIIKFRKEKKEELPPF